MDLLEKELGYKVTQNNILLNEEYGITPEISDLINKAFKDLQENKHGIIKKLQKLISEYPGIPHFKNYLTIAYANKNDMAKSWEMNEIIMREHSNYLFGKLNLANKYIIENELNKIPEVLGIDLDLKKLYPHRNEFHVVEFLFFSRIAINYYLFLDNEVKANKILNQMKLVDADSKVTYQAELQVMQYNLKKGLEVLKKEKAWADKKFNYEKTIQTNAEPWFYHKQIEQLYYYDLGIPELIIDELLDLPRETLIKDLENVILDCQQRYDYFRKKENKDGWNEKEFSFAVHALILLSELESEESLPAVLSLLRQENNLLEFWFSDLITEYLYEPIYKMGKNKLEELKRFLFEPNRETIVRSLMSSAVRQIPVYEPHRRDEVIRWYREVLNNYLREVNNEEIIDEAVIGLIVSDVTYLRGKELIPEIKELYKAGIVGELECGSLIEIIDAINRAPSVYDKREILNAAERYKDLQEMYRDMQDEFNYDDAEYEVDEDIPEDYEFLYNNSKAKEEKLQLYKPHIKIGRNELCPCGSGKKYKKCCMDKNLFQVD